MTEGMSRWPRKWLGSLVVDDPSSAYSALSLMDGLARADHLPAAGISRHPIAAGTLDDPVDVNELLHLICLAAIDAVPGAEYAGITLADRHGKLETPAATHPLVHRVDALQYELNQGPCVDAVQGGGSPLRTTCGSMSAGRNTVHWPPISASCRSWVSNCSTNPV